MANKVVIVIAIMLSVTFTQVGAVHARTKQAAQKPASSLSKPNFVGEVVNVDLGSRTMTLRNGRNLINFDISNAVLKGFGSLTDIKRGQTVGIRYLPDAIHIERGGTLAPSTPPAKSAQSAKKPQFSRRVKTDGFSFFEVDNNKDGYISPIELCVPFPNLTMEQFKQYDTNHDGRLDKAEFGQIKLK